MRLALAAASFELDRAKHGRIQLLPYGEFRATDGRPTDVAAWLVTDSNGADVVALANRQQNPLPIDYEHQIIHSKTNGKEAPSAGWMDYLYFTPQGIFADVRWTDKAAEYIKNGEYRYISAVFSYDTDGYVRKIWHAALTNNPALDGMEEAMVAATHHFIMETDSPMDKELLAMLCGLFGKPNADEAAIKADVAALVKSKGSSTVALSAVYEQLNEKEQRVAALSAQAGNGVPDPAKYVPVETVAALQADLNKLQNTVESDKKQALVTEALSAGKLSPALKGWALSLSVEALSQFIEQATPIAALSGEQGKTPPQDKVAALSADDADMARLSGMSAEDYAKLKTEYEKGGK